MSLETLPDDVVHSILTLLPVQDALALGRTSKRLNALTESIYHWGPRARASPYNWLLNGCNDMAWARSVATGVESAHVVKAIWDGFEGPNPSASKTRSPKCGCFCGTSWGWTSTAGYGSSVSPPGGSADSENGLSSTNVDRAERMNVPFAVADLAVSRCFLIVVTTEGEVWQMRTGELGRVSEPRHLYRVPIPAIPRREGAAKPGTQKKKARAVQALADGGCETADGQVHYWGAMAGPYGDEAVISSNVLPGIRMATLCRDHLIALTDDGTVWVCDQIWYSTMEFPPWLKLSALSCPGATLLAASNDTVAIAKGTTVRVGHLRYLTTPPTVQTLSGEYSSTFDDHVHTFHFPVPIAELAILNELVVNVGGRDTVDDLYTLHHPRNFLPAHLESSSNE